MKLPYNAITYIESPIPKQVLENQFVHQTPSTSEFISSGFYMKYYNLMAALLILKKTIRYAKQNNPEFIEKFKSIHTSKIRNVLDDLAMPDTLITLQNQDEPAFKKVIHLIEENY